MNEIIIAILSLIGVIVTALLKAFSENVSSRLDRLEKKVDQHNSYAEKFGEINEAIVEIRTSLKFIEKGIK